MIDSLRTAFAAQFGDADGVRFAMAPGRVNLLGEHTDYNDGLVLPMTVDRGVYLAVRERPDDRVRLYSARFDERLERKLRSLRAASTAGWGCYVLGVVSELRERGLVDAGFDAVIDGDLPMNAGLSSSAALEVATAVALQQLFGFDLSPVETAKLCQQVEHKYAKVKCGIMDQFASRIGRRDHALFLDCRSLEHEHVPMNLGEHRIIIIDSGVERRLADSDYNARRAECQAVVEFFQRRDPEVRALRDVSEAMLERDGNNLDENLRRRCRHIVSENRRVKDALRALRSDALGDFGALMNASQKSLRDDFEVSCPELDRLVELAQVTDGVLGSRMTGAGFGGCTVSLAHRDAIRPLVDAVDRDYAKAFGLQPQSTVLERNLEAGPVVS